MKKLNDWVLKRQIGVSNPGIEIWIPCKNTVAWNNKTAQVLHWIGALCEKIHTRFSGIVFGI